MRRPTNPVPDIGWRDRGAPARALSEQAKPQYPVLILAAIFFAPSTTDGSDGGNKLLRRRCIGCHRIAPLLQSGDRLTAAQPEIRDAVRLSFRQNAGMVSGQMKHLAGRKGDWKDGLDDLTLRG